MKKTISFLALILLTGFAFAQKKTTTSAIVSFDASTPKDALPKAENKTVIGSIDTKTGAIAFEAAVKSFSFSNPKMQEHFNGANWFNSDTYPSFVFTGKIEKMKDVNFGKDGEYKVWVSGQMKIRDISHDERVEGLVKVSGGKISVSANFSIKLDDYKISGQPIEAGKVAKEPKISISADFQ